MTMEMTFGQWLRRRRKALDLTQAELARQVGCATVTLQKIELEERRPSREIAERLAKVLDVPAEQRDAFLKRARGQVGADDPATMAGGMASGPSVAHPVSNLPVQRERLIGRDREVAHVRDLLLREDIGLVTLTGPGGVGKTRLALAVAAEVLPRFADGSFVVDLAPIRDAAQVAASIARVLGLRETTGQRLIATVTTYLRDKQVLLLLDNFEQVVDAASLLADLLNAAAGLKLVVTSRTPLRLRGERLVAVAPLAVPASGQQLSLNELRTYAAVELFVQRAQAVQPDFVLDAPNSAAIVAVCRALDGLPLALELAAARLRHLHPRALLDQLQRRFEVLADGPRDLAVRQRSLAATIAWSYTLLLPAEQALFRALGVFVGGWTRDAVREVCAPIGDQTAIEAGVFTLLDHSLVLRVRTLSGTERFTMLQTLRAFASEQLEARGEAAALRERHARYYSGLQQRLEKRAIGAQRSQYLAFHQEEHANLTAALMWGMGHPQVWQTLYRRRRR